MRAQRTPPDRMTAQPLAALVPLLLLLLLPAPHAARAQGPAPAPQGPAPTPQGPAATPAATPGEARERRPALTGRVVGEGGEPVPEVAVSAVSRGAGGSMRTPFTAVSDEGGNFRIAGLDPGLYQVVASMPGLVLEFDPATGRPGNAYRPGEDVTLRLVRGAVITGAVTDQQGQPLVQLTVRAVRVRDLDGTAAPNYPFTLEDRTDDRGVYRIYGLRPGLYVVYAGGYSNSPAPSIGNGGDAPTFYPSGTRDTAAEVSVRGGQEAAGIDIRFREEPGRRVTGTVESAGGFFGDPGTSLSLTYASTEMPAGYAYVNANASERSFSFEGLADGEYDAQATAFTREGSGAGPVAASAPVRVSVRGADVTGLRLTLTPLASVSGTLRFEPAAEAERALEACREVRPSQLPQEMLVAASPEQARARPAPGRASPRLGRRDAMPDEAGAFTIRSLEAGRYRLSALLFDEALYVRSVQGPGAAPRAAATPAAPGPRRRVGAAQQPPPQQTAAAAAGAGDAFEVRAGQQLSGVVVRVAQGAASLSGSVAPAEGAPPPPFSQMRVHLVPKERERAEDVLRYYEAAVGADGSFTLRNLAPGRYLALARASVPDPNGGPARPAAWDPATRAQLRGEAESADTAVELAPCQRAGGFALRFPPK